MKGKWWKTYIFDVRGCSRHLCLLIVFHSNSRFLSFFLSLFRMRLERIKRNQEYLATLGLEENNTKPVKKKKRVRPSVPAAPVEPRSSLSRRTKTRVSYVPQPLRIPTATSSSTLPKNTASSSSKPSSEAKATPKRKERKASERMDRGIYDEFKRIASSRRELLKQAKRQVRTADKEVKHWSKQARKFQRKDGLRKEIETMLHANAQQQAVLGTTSLQLLQEIDHRNLELLSVVIKFDDRQKVNDSHDEKRFSVLVADRCHSHSCHLFFICCYRIKNVKPKNRHNNWNGSAN